MTIQKTREQSKSFRTLHLLHACKECYRYYHSDAATAMERQQSDLFAICTRSFSYASSGSSTELIVLARCTDWSSLFMRTFLIYACVGIPMCWFRAILQQRIISQSTHIVAYEWNWMQKGVMYLTSFTNGSSFLPRTRSPKVKSYIDAAILWRF